MRRIILALFLIATALTSAAAGSITLTYSGAPGGAEVSISAGADISDADAATLMTWCASSYSSVGDVSTPQKCFQILASSISVNIVQQVLEWQSEQASVAARKKVAPITITPQN